MSQTIDMTPTWETAVQIYCAVLENPNASPEGRATARDEIYRLARAFDEMNAEPEPEPEPEPKPNPGVMWLKAEHDDPEFEPGEYRWRAERRYQNAAERDELDLY